MGAVRRRGQEEEEESVHLGDGVGGARNQEQV